MPDYVRNLKKKKLTVDVTDHSLSGLETIYILHYYIDLNSDL
jgi:hypothetical protein